MELQCLRRVATEARSATVTQSSMEEVPRQPMPVHKLLQIDKHRLSAVDRREHRQGLQAAFTGAPTEKKSPMVPETWSVHAKIYGGETVFG